MDGSDISRIVDEIVLEIMPEAADITEAEVFERLDSLELFDLVFKVEERFGVTIEDSELDALITKAALVDVISRRIAKT